jgi:hypothetical protein
MLPMANSGRVSVLQSLLRSPSRASAAAIGQNYVLNGVSPPLRMLGVDALAQMPCDWVVAILEEVILDPARGYDVRRHAILTLGDLLRTAIRKGYEGVNLDQCERWTRAADRGLTRQCVRGAPGEIPAIEDLCGHLGQAVADGYLGQLPDF